MKKLGALIAAAGVAVSLFAASIVGSTSAFAQLVNDGGTVTRSGTITGSITNENGGTFTAAGTLTGDGVSPFTNTDTSILNVPSGVSFTNIGTLTNSSVGAGGLAGVNVGAGATLSAGTINNSGTFDATGGTINGTFINTGTVNANGATLNGSVSNSNTINVNGTTTIGGSFNNTGSVNLASITDNVTATTNKLVVNGQYSGTGTLNVVYDLSQATGKAGELIINGVAAGSTATVTFSDSRTGGSLTAIQLGSHATVISNTGTGTFANLTGQNLQFGLVDVVLQPTNGGAGAQLVALANLAATASPGASIVASLGAIDSSFHQSGAPFVASPESMDPDKWTGGLWTRETTGQTTTKSVTTDSFGQQTALDVKTRFDAYEGGLDTGRLNLGGTGWNAHFGVNGGGVTANANEFLSGSGTAVKFDIPFAGVYGVLNHGNLVMDLEYRHDWVKTQVSNATADLTNAALNGNGDAVSGAAMYHFDLPRSWFVEPTAGFGYSRTQFGALATNPNSISQGTINFGTLSSFLAHTGARVGTTVTVDNLALQPYTILSVWRELEGQSSATFNTSGGGTPDALLVTRVGTFYQASLGVAAAAGTNLVGFVRGDLRWGANLNGAGIVGGLRYSFGS